jgi:hypothetical protein
MILAHIKAGDLVRAVEWYDGMQGDGQEDNRLQGDEIEIIRRTLDRQAKQIYHYE